MNCTSDVEHKRLSFRLEKPVRSNILFNAMEKELGCRIENCKGSEKKIITPSGRVGRVKHHRQNQQIRPTNIRKLLTKLRFEDADCNKLLKCL